MFPLPLLRAAHFFLMLPLRLSAGRTLDKNARYRADVYKRQAQSVAFMANNDAGFEATDAKMVEYQDLLGVDNVLVVDRDGTVVASAQDTQANFCLLYTSRCV